MDKKVNIEFPGGELTLNNVPFETGEVSDGYHTFNELYTHRHALFLVVCSLLRKRAWWSRKHEDGSEMPGWVIAGVELPTGPITYHLPVSFIPYLKETGAREQGLGEPWDGHTSENVVDRLLESVTEWKPSQRGFLVTVSSPNGTSRHQVSGTDALAALANAKADGLIGLASFVESVTPHFDEN